jgi:hypothetical protein
MAAAIAHRSTAVPTIAKPTIDIMAVFATASMDARQLSFWATSPHTGRT